ASQYERELCAGGRKSGAVRRGVEKRFSGADSDLGRAADFGTSKPDSDRSGFAAPQTERDGRSNGSGDSFAELSGQLVGVKAPLDVSRTRVRNFTNSDEFIFHFFICVYLCPSVVKFKLTIAYDGTEYEGWQVQKIGTGVQEK